MQIKFTRRLRFFPMETDFAVGIGKKTFRVSVFIKVIIQQQIFYKTGEAILRFVIVKSVMITLMDKYQTGKVWYVRLYREMAQMGIDFTASIFNG